MVPVVELVIVPALAEPVMLNTAGSGPGIVVFCTVSVPLFVFSIRQLVLVPAVTTTSVQVLDVSSHPLRASSVTLNVPGVTMNM